ncbi:hypothetical protein PoB_000102000 [Plakobranchus ocellatus]|uniref:Uncharacterized protein n=1 Tax=Plakobranchus ocellatus TaxID=259542 RepID=A0AAV3XVS5_9GAST|nr:hypothetical protein PoB_000102000 [Plakobranchus ocellatus]
MDELSLTLSQYVTSSVRVCPHRSTGVKDPLNEDCLEKRFAVIHNQGGNRFNPDSHEYKAALRQCKVDSVKTTSERQNCKQDLDSLLFSLENIGLVSKDSKHSVRPFTNTATTARQLFIARVRFSILLLLIDFRLHFTNLYLPTSNNIKMASQNIKDHEVLDLLDLSDLEVEEWIPDTDEEWDVTDEEDDPEPNHHEKRFPMAGVNKKKHF